MSTSEPALAVRADKNRSLTYSFDDRHWRVRGLEKQLSCERLRVSLMVSRRELLHVDTLDLYVSRMRRSFIKEAAAELYVEEKTIKKDLGHVLLELEKRQDALIQQTLVCREPEVPAMTEQEQREAMDLLQDPQLVDRILEHFEACGLVGEATNKLVCYLACVSRLLPQPLSVLVQSSSAAGKTTLQDAVLRFMPPETQTRLSALTAQSLYYMPEERLRHKILAVAEEDGLAEATYALKILQSDGKLSIASAGRDGLTGRQQTRLYEVQGPVALLLTTTAEVPHPELANRCLVLHTNEHPDQTAAIHQCQRSAYSRKETPREREKIISRHQNAQRLLEPLEVIIPWADQLTFRTDQTRYRRDHAKYLSLIASVTLLHQYQRQRAAHVEHGPRKPCVVAALEDIERANRLAVDVLCEPADAMMPQTGRLLGELNQYVTEQAKAQQILPEEVRFTQRELRKVLERSDRSVRTHLGRLVQLEYVVAYRTGRGNQYAYQLLAETFDPQEPPRSRLGLVDVSQLQERPNRQRRSATPKTRDSANTRAKRQRTGRAKTAETARSGNAQNPC